VLTVVDLSDQWITVNLREDRLAGLKIGDTLTAVIPALGPDRLRFRVYYISPLGSLPPGGRPAKRAASTCARSKCERVLPSRSTDSDPG